MSIRTTKLCHIAIFFDSDKAIKNWEQVLGLSAKIIKQFCLPQGGFVK